MSAAVARAAGVRAVTTRAGAVRRPPDSGSVAVEAAILVPAVVALVLIVAGVGRIQTTGGVVDAAARAGARAASLARTPEGAQQAAEDAARDVFDKQHVPCTDLQISQPPSDPVTIGTEVLQTVDVRVTCNVPLGYLVVDGTPGSKTLKGEFVSVVDRYRSAG
ncbi:TadE/TadG family type IV pilus assembly protein [Kitasatospora sp. MAP5-34]|uniref:TadE/TadG family type IV pilus assembly protein n=1 Tax=Kitasatospora sp. MAP5-34 TaxID=3035102 RepID=UPI002475A8ED|nr:TadE/TadG family type IV pilus assembly protein [Kitasatospora sp. MAP5-34]MDH6575160.1 Flp pilus assembly protein TadG [Kitasatospora sp. MAP5-34]